MRVLPIARIMRFGAVAVSILLLAVLTVAVPLRGDAVPNPPGPQGPWNSTSPAGGSPHTFLPAPNPNPYCESPDYFDEWDNGPASGGPYTIGTGAGQNGGGIIATLTETSGSIVKPGAVGWGVAFTPGSTGQVTLSEPMFYTQWVFSDNDVANEGFQAAASYSGNTAAVVATAAYGANPDHTAIATQPNQGWVYKSVTELTTPDTLIGRSQIDFFGPVDTVDLVKTGGGYNGFQMGGGCAALGVAKEVTTPPQWDPATQRFTVTYDVLVQSNLPDAAKMAAVLAVAATLPAADVPAAPPEIPVQNLQIVDPQNFPGATPVASTLTTNTAAIGPFLNPNYDGVTDQNLLLPGFNLSPQQTEGITITTEFEPDFANPVWADGCHTWTNQAEASGIAATADVGDVSDEGSNPAAAATNGGGGANDPTVVDVCFEPEIETTKELNGAPTLNGDGTIDVAYTITIENTGDVDLDGAQVTDDLLATFGAGSTFTSIATSATGPCSGQTNSSFDGTSDTNLLTPNAVTLTAAGTTTDCTIELSFTVDPGNDVVVSPGTTYVNGVNASGSQGALPVATDDDKETFTLEANPGVELDKQFPGGTLAVGSTISYPLVVTNTGNIDLVNVTVVDPTAGPVTCPATTLAVGANMTCTATYVITQADMNAGEIENTAKVGGDSAAGGESVSDGDTIEVPLLQDPEIVVEKLAQNTAFNAGETINYTFEVENTGNVTLDPVSVSDPLIGTVTCPQTSLDPSESTVCTGSYVVSQADIDAGTVTNVATASGEDPSGDTVEDEDTAVTPSPSVPNIAIDKLPPTGTLALGETLTYSFTVTNTGNVTLSSVSVADPTTGPVTCPATTLAPGSSTTCTATYVVTQADVDAGEIVNEATASGESPSGEEVDDDDTETTEIEQNPSISIDKEATSTVTAAGQTVTYDFTVTNSGDVTLTSVNVVDPLVAPVLCPLTVLAPGASTVCTGSYVATQADIDNGSITNTAVAIGDDPAGAEVRDDDTEVSEIEPEPSVAINKLAPSGVLAVDQAITYSFVVTNDGNVTLTNVSVADPLTGPITCPTNVIAPGVSVTCTATYVVTQADVDAGEIVNTATAFGDDPDGESTESDPDTETTEIEQNPEIEIVKEAQNEPLVAGDTIDYEFTVTNTGDVTLDNIEVDDPLASPVTCPGTMLAPGASMVCSASYTVDQADVDAGSVENTATAEGDDPGGNTVDDEDTETTPNESQPSLSIDKLAPTGTLAVDETISYSFTVTNTGNVTLTDIAVSDPLTEPVNCPSGPVAPTASITCTATYIVTQVDVDAGEIVNTATASGDAPDGGTAESEPDTETTEIEQNPAIEIDKESPADVLNAGETLAYTFTVTNTGDVTMNNITVSDPLAAPVTCPGNVLAPGASMVCTASYVATQADVDGGEIVNTATVTGDDPGGDKYLDGDTETTPAPAEPSIVIDKLAPSGTLAVNETITYSFIVSNDGNVTLSNVAVADPLTGPVTCPTNVIAPDVSITCIATYVVTQADVDAGQIVNTATASGEAPDGASTESDPDTEITEIEQNPDIDIDKETPAEVLNAGETLTYTFAVTNSGDVTMYNIFVEDELADPVSCPTIVLAPGGVMVCTATYTVTQDDIDAGEVINTAVVTGSDPGGEEHFDADTETTPSPSGPSIVVDKLAPDGVLAVDETITYSFIVSNDGNVTLSNVAVDDPLANPVACSAAPLAPGASITCIATYVVTQADVDAGEIVNTATAAGEAPDGESTESDPDTETTKIEQNPGIEIDKETPAEVLNAGETLAYSFVVTNTGDVTMNNIVVSDPLAAPVTCPGNVLAPGAAMTCTASYTVTQADVDSGEIVNTGSVTGDDPGGEAHVDGDTETTPSPAEPSIVVDKLAPDGVLAVGEPVTYSFIVSNDGNVTLSNVTVSDPLTGPVTCPTNVIAPGVSITCAATYVVTQADVDAGEIVNTATAEGEDPNGDSVDDEDTETTEIEQNPGIEVDKEAQNEPLVLGDVIEYEITVTNTGDVTLSNIDVDDPLAAPVSCPGDTLAPGDDMVCTAEYTVTQADVDAGSVVNTATAEGEDPGGDTVEGEDTETTPNESEPSLSIDKKAPLGTLALGETIFYSFTVINTGNVTLTNLTVDDPLVGPVTCPVTTMAPGLLVTCNASYVVTQADVDAGEIVNTATAEGEAPDGEAAESDPDTETTEIEQNPGIEVDKEAQNEPLVLGDVIEYEITVTNTGDVTLSNIDVDDPLADPVTCPSTVLAPGDEMVCTAEYTVTQADVDAGSVVNTATAEGEDPGGDTVEGEDTETTPNESEPSLMIDKLPPAGVLAVDEAITYSFVVTNDGNVTISNVTVDDPLTGPVTCPINVIAPGVSITCTATYVVTQPDVDAGQIVNTATAEGEAPDGEAAESDPDTETTEIEQNPGIEVDKEAQNEPLVLGDVIEYEITVTNTGDVTLSNIDVDDPLADPVTCPSTVLAPGAEMVCTAEYTVTQADVDAGSIVNTATAEGEDPGGDTVEGEDTETTPNDSEPSLMIDKLPPAGVLAVDEAITYSFVVTNDGNVTISNVTVDDPLTGPVACPTPTLAPAGLMTCTATYVVTQADVDAGQIVNTATAAGEAPDGETAESDPDTETTELDQNPAIEIDKESTTEALNAGETIAYTFVVTNSGDVTMNNIVVSDPLAAPVTCPGNVLPPGASMTCTASYTVTQDDVDSGEVVNTGSVTGDDPGGDAHVDGDTETTPSPAGPSIVVDKLAPSGVLAAGEAITYSFIVSNDGNVTLSNVTVSDPLTGPVTCPTNTIAPGVSITCSAIYVVTQADVDAGEIVNTASAEGQDPTGDAVGDEDSETTEVEQNPALEVDKQAQNEPLVLGDVIDYEITVTNTGDVTLNNIAVDDPLANPVTCPGTVLAPGDLMTCTASYEVTQDDIDAGQVVNIAEATGDAPDGESTSDSDVETTGAEQSGSIEIDKHAPTGNLAVGETLTWTFEVTNTGNVTLSNVTVSDPLTGPVACNTATLAPGDSTLCTAQSELTQQQIDDGQIVNSAVATGEDPSGDSQSADDTHTEPLPQTPALAIDKASSGAVGAGGTIEYTFVVSNVGNVTISDIEVDDPLAAPVLCPQTTLAPGDSMTCTATYAVTQDDVENGSVINTVDVTGTDPSGEDVDGTDTEETDVEQEPTLSVEKFGPAGPLEAGAVVTYNFTVSNTGTVTLTNVTVIDPTAGPVFCATNILVPGQATSCTANYFVTQQDIDAGQVVNVATGSGTAPDGSVVTDDGEATSPAPQNPALEVDKQASASELVVDEVIVFTFEVTNTGNVTIANVIVDDPMLASGVVCSDTTLAPAEATTCSGSYTVTQADVDAGTIENTATAFGDAPGGSVSGSDTETIPGEQTPAIVIDKIAPAGPFALGDAITYQLDVTNAGNVTLTGIDVTDPTSDGVTCPDTTLLPGATMSCSATRPVTQVDVDAGTIVNVATASAIDPNGELVGDDDTEVSAIVQVPALDVVKNAPTGDLIVGSELTYTFDVINTGNVTVTDLQVNDPLTGPVECVVTSLAPLDTTTCSAQYTVTQADVDAGGITNSVLAIASTPAGPATGDDEIATPITGVAQLDLVKSAPLGTLAVGTPAVFTLTATNTGTVTLTNVVVADPLADSLVCGASTLSPGQSTTCTAIIIVTQAMVDNGEIVNEATAQGDAPDGMTTSDTDTASADVLQNPAINIDKDAPVGVLEVGESITYTFVVTNTGNVTVTAFSIDDPKVIPISCDASSLAPGQQAVCSGTYVVIQDDVDLGEIQNVASVNADTPAGTVADDDSEITEWDTEAGLVLTKSEPTGDLTLGSLIVYNFTATNTGDVVLTNLVIDDPMTSAVVCDKTTLAPAETAACSSTYVITQTDVDQGLIANVATAEAIDPTGASVEDIAERTTQIDAESSIDLVKTASTTSAELGDVITYQLVVTNTGQTQLNGIAISDPSAFGVQCPATALAPGTSMSCSASVTVNQNHINAGAVTNNASVVATTPTGGSAGDTDSTTVDTETEVVEPSNDPSIELKKSGPAITVSAGDTIQYQFDVTNTGDVTISDLAIADPRTSAVTCPVTTLSPGGTVTCSATYVVTSSDAAAGIILNSATASGSAPGDLGEVESVSATDIVETQVAKPANPAPSTPSTPSSTPFVPSKKFVPFPTNSGSPTPAKQRSTPSSTFFDPPDSLAFTGSRALDLSALGLALLLIGGAGVIAGKRREDENHVSRR